MKFSPIPISGIPVSRTKPDSRKFCDISYAAWAFLGRPRKPFPYEDSLVQEIVNNCESGDPRPAVETAEDDVIEKITKRFAFFEDFLSEKFLGGAPVFKQRYPSTYGKTRAPFHPIDRREVKLLTELIVLRREVAKMASAAQTALQYGGGAENLIQNDHLAIREDQHMANEVAAAPNTLPG